jgi:hypothetical protein
LTELRFTCACDELAIDEVDNSLHPHDRIAARLLLREAEELIAGEVQ